MQSCLIENSSYCVVTVNHLALIYRHHYDCHNYPWTLTHLCITIFEMFFFPILNSYSFILANFMPIMFCCLIKFHEMVYWTNGREPPANLPLFKSRPIFTENLVNVKPQFHIIWLGSGSENGLFSKGKTE